MAGRTRPRSSRALCSRTRSGASVASWYPENGVPLDTLISELAKGNVVTALKAKRARAAAGLRTSAAHARWEEIQLSDVNPVIEFTRELMAAHLE